MPQPEDEEHSDDGEPNEGQNTLRYISADLAKGMYAMACLAIDVFVILQIYDWFPSPTVAILSFLLLVALSGTEIWVYRFVKRFVGKKEEGF